MLLLLLLLLLLFGIAVRSSLSDSNAASYATSLSTASENLDSSLKARWFRANLARASGRSGIKKTYLCVYVYTNMYTCLCIFINMYIHSFLFVLKCYEDIYTIYACLCLCIMLGLFYDGYRGPSFESAFSQGDDFAAGGQVLRLHQLVEITPSKNCQSSIRYGPTVGTQNQNPYGGFQKLGVHFLAVLVIRALPFKGL